MIARVIVVVGVLTGGGTLIPAQDAPLGFSWGHVDQIPKPWRASREANITTLFYDHTSSVAAGADTDQVIVEICQSEGLQEVIWISRKLSGDELQRKFALMHQEGVSRYGEPNLLSMPMTESWKDGRVFLGTSDGQQRLVMFVRGALFDHCSAEHRVQSGHRAEQHFENLKRGTY